MPRNPYWTDSDAALVRGSNAFQSPDGDLTFRFSDAKSYDEDASVSGSFTSGETIDYLTVTLKAGSTYNFLATGDYQVSIAIYDKDGYLLSFDDGDDIGIPDAYPRDSILYFKPDYTGTYIVNIYYANIKTTGKYVIVASEDAFSDGKNTYGLDYKVENAINRVLMLDSTTSQAATVLGNVADKTHAGTWTVEQGIDYVVNQADATTTVANLSYQFFTGKTPQASGLTYLVSPTGPNGNNLNSAYYQNFNLENRYINFAVNLGINGEGKTKFAADYGGLTLAEATKKAYATIFGAAPADAKISALLSDGRDAYFESYGHDGLNGLGTKAAMVGWLLAEAAKGDIGVYSRASNAYLHDAASTFQYAVDLVGFYGKAEYIYGG